MTSPDHPRPDSVDAALAQPVSPAAVLARTAAEVPAGSDADADRRAQRCAALAAHLRRLLGTGPARRAMDIGTGSGGVSPLLADLFDELVLVDVDPDALDRARAAVTAAAPSGTLVRTALVDLSRDIPRDAPERHLLGPFDVVYTVLALHHVPDAPRLLATAAGTLRPGGRLVVADLEPDGGLYHAHLPDFDGHDGFRRDQLLGWFHAAGLRLDSFTTAYVDRKVVDGTAHLLPIFVASATRATAA